jgi:hypothetical protein
VAGVAVLVAGMEEAVIQAALAGMALVRVGITLALVGTAGVVAGTVGTGMMGVVAGIMAVAVVAGELAPRLVSVLALDYSGARSRRHPIMAAMTTATITPRMPVHPHLRFGIGAMPIRAIILPYPNARFRGLFSNGWAKPYRFPEAHSDLTRWASGIAMSLTSRTPLRQRARSCETPSSSPAARKRPRA